MANKKMQPTFWLLIISVIGSLLSIGALIVSYFITEENNKQTNRIEQLGTINKDLGINTQTIAQNIDTVSGQIKELSGINNSLGEKNNELSSQNLQLTTEVKALIQKVEQLSNQSKFLIDKLDVKTDQEFAVTGKFDFAFDLRNISSDIVMSMAGSNTISFSLENLNANRGNYQSLFGSANPQLEIMFVNYKLVVNTKVYDLHGNLVAEIFNNNWRVNKNQCSKFNYDDSGFEIFDNTGRIVLNLDIYNTTVTVQGITIKDFKSVSVISPRWGLVPFSYSDPELIPKVYKHYDNEAQIVQLFQYTGNKWHGVRRIRDLPGYLKYLNSIR